MEDKMAGVHLSYCDQGEYIGVCKFGSEDCPALVENDGKRRLVNMGSTIESNIAYQLIEVEGKLVKELQIVPCRSFIEADNDKPPIIQMTPFGIADMAIRMLVWAARQDSKIDRQYPNITSPK